MDYASCPACSSRQRTKLEGHVSLYTCRKCGALYGTCYLGESYALVHPHFSATPDVESRYFDFTTLGSKGLDRRHGWYNPTDRCLTQAG